MSTSTAPAPERPLLLTWPSPAPVAPPVPHVVDVLPLWDYFQAGCEARKISIEEADCHRIICQTYEAAICGFMPGIEYFITNMPRRIGKTKILEFCAAWTIGEFANAQLIGGCYSEMLIKRSLAFIGSTLRHPFHLDLYGDHLHTMRADLVTTLEGGTIYGAGTTATVTGFGAGLKEPAGGYVWLDDPAKPDEALSKVSSAAVIQNFETTWKGCRNSDSFTPIIINAQRLGPDDLPGYILKTYPEKTHLLKFPCFVQGFSQFPLTWSDDTMVGLQKTRIGRFVLASQFQQEPISLGGNLIKTDDFKYYDPAEAKVIEWEAIVITIDTALKTKEANDYSCAQAWGRANRRAYLLDQAWGKWESPQLLQLTVAFWGKVVGDYPMAPVKMQIEEKAAGTGLIQQLNQNGIPAEGIERDIDKVRRVQSILTYQEAGLVYVPAPTKVDENHFVHGFLTECAEFKPDMTHAHDDRVDCFADGVKELLGEPLSILDVLGTPPRR